VSRTCLLLCAVLLPLLVASCRREAAPPASSEESHIRIEPARAPTDPLRGKTPSGAATADEIGIDFYPQATLQKSSLVRDDRGVTAAATLSTRDAYADVTFFYRQRYEAGSRVVKLDSKGGHGLAINWQTPSGNFTIEIKQDVAGKQTLIHLVRLTGKREAAPPPARAAP
jgi:hypothetical protein